MWQKRYKIRQICERCIVIQKTTYLQTTIDFSAWIHCNKDSHQIWPQCSVLIPVPGTNVNDRSSAVKLWLKNQWTNTSKQVHHRHSAHSQTQHEVISSSSSLINTTYNTTHIIYSHFLLQLHFTATYQSLVNAHISICVCASPCTILRLTLSSETTRINQMTEKSTDFY